MTSPISPRRSAHGSASRTPQLTELRRAATLHDIGKIAIPDTILHAPRPLDPDEWEYMRRHTIIGERIIGAAPELLAVARAVRSSHERYDGAGYPDGLAGEQIPLSARIIAVCDSYDAMTSDRVYRPAMSGVRGARRAAALPRDPVRPRGRRSLPRRQANSGAERWTDRPSWVGQRLLTTTQEEAP